MPSHEELPGDITARLNRWSAGDGSALISVASLAYEDLRAIATAFLRRRTPGQSLNATGLVNELYIRLSAQRQIQVENRQHFFSLAAMMMRRIVADYARRSAAQKRPGGGESIRVPLSDDLAWIDASGDEMVSLDRALDELEAVDERALRIVELRYFLGCTNQETAALLQVSRTTVDRDLEYAKAWLFRRLSPARRTAG